jgi:hypothetical protein
MAFNINEFKSKVNKYGVAKDNLFFVEITGPALGAEFPSTDLRFFCRSVEIPGLSAQTAEYQNQGHGHNEKRVTNMSFDDLQMIFMVDSGYRVQQYFHRWMQAIVNYDNRDYGREYNNMLPFEVAYKDNVKGRVTVSAFGQNDNRLSYTYQFDDAYPITIGTTSLSWENNDTLLTLPVAFTFSKFIPVKGVGVSSAATPRAQSKTLGGGKSPLQVASSLDTFGGVLEAFGVNNPIQDVVDRFTSVSSSFNNLRNTASDFGNQFRNTISNL